MKVSKLKISLIIVSLIICITAILLGSILPFCKKTVQESPPPATYSTYNETINGVDWVVKYNNKTNEIITISSTYSYNERSSEYYNQLASQHGDNSVFVKHSITLNGSSTGNNWFLIEKTEVISNGWDNSEVFLDQTTRYEEKIIFTLP